MFLGSSLPQNDSETLSFFKNLTKMPLSEEEETKTFLLFFTGKFPKQIFVLKYAFFH